MLQGALPHKERVTHMRTSFRTRLTTLAMALTFQAATSSRSCRNSPLEEIWSASGRSTSEIVLRRGGPGKPAGAQPAAGLDLRPERRRHQDERLHDGLAPTPARRSSWVGWQCMDPQGPADTRRHLLAHDQVC